MKKIISLTLATILMLCVLPVCAESIDLSRMSFDELIALQKEINAALWLSDEWQEVTVPAGVYEIGKEIPAGYWTIKPSDGNWALVYWGTALDESGQNLDMWNSRFYNTQQIVSPKSSYFEYNNVESVSWNLTEGTYIIIESSSVVFSPYTGVSFGFK